MILLPRDVESQELAAFDDGDYHQTRSGLYVPVACERRQLRAADIFAGCGGFSLGMQTAGINVVAAVEWDPRAALTYLSNLGSVQGCAVAYVEESDRARLAKALKRDKAKEGWIGLHNPERDGSGCRAFVLGDATKVSGDLIRSALAAIGDDTTIDGVAALVLPQGSRLGPRGAGYRGRLAPTVLGGGGLIDTKRDWRDAFKACMTRISFELKLTRPMLELLCALSDDVMWDRSAFGGIHYPDNFLATEHALTRRGLIELRPPQKVRDGMPPPWCLTPVGASVVEMLKVGGLFIQAEAARQKLSKRRGRW